MKTFGYVVAFLNVGAISVSELSTAWYLILSDQPSCLG